MLETYPHFQLKLSTKKKEIKKIQKKKPISTISATTVDTSQYDHYSKVLREYEELEKKLNDQMNQVPPDLITSADQEAVIKAHFKDEEETER